MPVGAGGASPHQAGTVGAEAAVGRTLSVAVVVGARRERVARLLECLAQQTVAGSLELVLVDLQPSAGPIAPTSAIPIAVLAGPSLSYGAARALAARTAHGEGVAYLEDHCYPDAAWAESLWAAFTRPWAAVGHAISNANPGRGASGLVHLATYGQWQSPRRGSTTTLPGGNVAYRRELLLALGERLPAMLQADFNLHSWLRKNQLVMGIEPHARIQHESDASLRNALRSSFVYSRVLAADRARLGGWTPGRRRAWAAGNLGAAPLLRLVRLVKGVRADLRELGSVAVSLPGILAILLVSAAGEALGYLAGEGDAIEQLTYWEVHAPRRR